MTEPLDPNLNPSFPESSPQQTQSNHSPLNWNIIDFYKRSISLVKENPKLLLLGVALIVLSAGSRNNLNLRNNNFFNSTEKPELEQDQNSLPFEEIFSTDAEDLLNNINSEFETEPEMVGNNSISNQADPASEIQTEVQTEAQAEESGLLQLIQEGSLPDSPAEIADVLGAQFSPTFFDKLDAITQQVSNKIPSWVYILFILQIVALVLLMIVISLAITAWAQAAMIEGIMLADQVGHNSWKLSDATKKGISKILPMIWMNFMPTLKIVLWILALALVVPASVSLAFSLADVTVLLTVVLLVLAICAIVVVGIKIFNIFLSQLIGTRLIVLKRIPAKDAYRQSWQLIKGHKSKIVGLGVTHVIVLDAVLSMIVAAPLVAAVGGMIASNAEKFKMSDVSQIFPTILEIFTSGWIAIIAISLFITVLLSIALRVVTIVIKNTNWYWAVLSLLSSTTVNQEQTYQEGQVQNHLINQNNTHQTYD